MKILHKFTAIFFSLALLPLLSLAAYSMWTVDEIQKTSIDDIHNALEEESMDHYAIAAERLAGTVTHFLEEREIDVMHISGMDRSNLTGLESEFAHFQHCSIGKLWLNLGTTTYPISVNYSVPLYSEISLTDKYGQQLVRVQNGSVVATKLNLSTTAALPYMEDVFGPASQLSEGEIYVSRVMTPYISRDDVFAGMSDADQYNYSRVSGLDTMKEGVLAFATPVFNGTTFDGVIMLNLDYRHLREITKHIEPTMAGEVTSSSYEGNYVFIYDDEGTIIVHPKPDNVRGMLSNSTIPAARVKGVSADEAVFNLYAYNDGYRDVVNMVLGNDTVYTNRTTDVSGRTKIAISAPIPYDVVPYNSTGLFGGIFISVNQDVYSKTIEEQETAISEDLGALSSGSHIILFFMVILMFIIVSVVVEGITIPINRLVKLEEEITKGELEYEVLDTKRDDEIGDLARAFARMAERASQCIRYVAEQDWVGTKGQERPPDNEEE